MLEITLYPSDLIRLQNGERLIMFDIATGKQELALVMDKPDEIKVCYSKLPTENVDNPVSNCS